MSESNGQIINNIFKEIDTIKKDVISTRNKVLTNANSELLNLYYRIGGVISKNQMYGSNFINLLSQSLKNEFPNASGFSPRNLARMKKFYDEYKDLSISPSSAANLPTALAKLPWSFNNLLIDRIKTIEKRIWYAEKCIENGWSYVVLDHQIDLELYERQADNTKKLSNFGANLPEEQQVFATNILKDPYIFELVGITQKSKEIDIERAMIDRIKSTLLELGKGFSFIGNQYRISTNNKDYYIDLLFYHLKLRCYVVIELKNDDFDPSYVGQLQFYIAAIDDLLKTNSDNPTIGLLLCKNKDKYTVELSLKATTTPISVASYEIKKYLPTEEEINNCLKITKSE